MAFHEIRLDDCVAFGAKGGAGFSTDVITTRSRHESRNANWSQALHRWDIGFITRTLTELEMIRTHFMVVGGRRDGFRFKDVTDYQVTVANGVLQGLHGTAQVGTAGTGYGTPVTQLRKRYAVGALSYDRDIRKPVRVTLYRAGIAVALGAGAGQAAIDLTTGLVTMVADQSRTISSHTPSPTHVFTLASAFSPNIAIGGRIFVTGVTGTAATLLNGMSHAVTGVTSAVITTSTVTTGLTASGGTAFFYPQPTETFTWAGEFDVPVRFDVDQFDSVPQDKGSGGELLIDLPSIPVIEIRV